MATAVNPVRQVGDALVIDLLVSPGASRARLGPRNGDRIKLSVTVPPEDGAANEAVLLAVAEGLGVPRSAVELVTGKAGRRKTVRVHGVTLAQANAALGA